MIPKKLHFIWLGSDFPSKYSVFLDSWREHHSGWEITLWDDHDAKNFPMKRRDVFDAAPNWGAKSDVFRYEILYALGGVYADTDFLCIRPFDHLLKYDFFCGPNEENTQVYNGLIGCPPESPVIAQVLDNLKVPNEGTSSVATFIATGPTLFSKVVYDFQNKRPGSVTILPVDAFYPMPNTFSRTAEPPWKQYITDQTYAVHFWEYSWQKRTLWESLRKAILKPVPASFKTWIKSFLKGKKS